MYCDSQHTILFMWFSWFMWLFMSAHLLFFVPNFFLPFCFLFVLLSSGSSMKNNMFLTVKKVYLQLYMSAELQSVAELLYLYFALLWTYGSGSYKSSAVVQWNKHINLVRSFFERVRCVMSALLQ